MKNCCKECTYCKSQHFLSYYKDTNKAKFYFNDNFLKNKFLCFTTQTMYEISLLDWFSSDLLFKHCSFYSFCQSYNYFYKIPFIANKQNTLCRKRLTETWLLYRYCRHSFEKNGYFLEKKFVIDLDSALMELRPTLLEYFVNKWANIMNHKNKCSKDCSKLYVLDGIIFLLLYIRVV